MRLEVVTKQGLVFKWRGNGEQAKRLLEVAEKAVLSYERAESARLEVAKLRAARK